MKVGTKVKTWFSGEPDGMSTVIDIQPYTGRYPQFFNCVLTLTAARTKKGCIEMAAQCTLESDSTE